MYTRAGRTHTAHKAGHKTALRWQGDAGLRLQRTALIERQRCLERSWLKLRTECIQTKAVKAIGLVLRCCGSVHASCAQCSAPHTLQIYTVMHTHTHTHCEYQGASRPILRPSARKSTRTETHIHTHTAWLSQITCSDHYDSVVM